MGEGMASYQLGFGSGLGGWGVGFWLGDGGGDGEGIFWSFFLFLCVSIPSRSTIHIPIDEQVLRDSTFRISGYFCWLESRENAARLPQWENNGKS